MRLISREVGLGLDLLQYLYCSQGSGEPITACQMATDLQESEMFIQKILHRLKRNGFVNSRRGPGGGFRFVPGIEFVTLDRFFNVLHKGFEPGILTTKFASEIGQRLISDVLKQTTIKEVITNGNH